MIDCLRHYAETRGAHPAVEEGTRKLTYQGLYEQSEQAAANLSATGVLPGDVVVLMLDDRLEHFILLCALARIGAIMFSIDPGQPATVVEQNRRAVDAKFIIQNDIETPFHGVRTLS